MLLIYGVTVAGYASVGDFTCIVPNSKAFLLCLHKPIFDMVIFLYHVNLCALFLKYNRVEYNNKNIIKCERPLLSDKGITGTGRAPCAHRVTCWNKLVNPWNP